ncbi:hypothetical protein PMIN01_03481 [Paraphaeosphaeria minitans]|uniref:Uncharacterized protein n=1 Tax=Paraphaeosphaeria minitans TaxID=565426 RepID=A0A9P6GMM3_9PLEO|nr:hypothetical protein PMIN01_03481 [Paraphaeosphaeria minitans]
MLIRLAGLEQRLYEANARSLRGRHFRAGARIADLLVVLDPPAVLESAPTHVESQTIWMRLKRENPPANLRRTNILVMDMKIVPRELVAARECPAILIGSSQTGSFRLRYEAVVAVEDLARRRPHHETLGRIVRTGSGPLLVTSTIDLFAYHGPGGPVRRLWYGREGGLYGWIIVNRRTSGWNERKPSFKAICLVQLRAYQARVFEQLNGYATQVESPSGGWCVLRLLCDHGNDVNATRLDWDRCMSVNLPPSQLPLHPEGPHSWRRKQSHQAYFRVVHQVVRKTFDDLGWTIVFVVQVALPSTPPLYRSRSSTNAELTRGGQGERRSPTRFPNSSKLAYLLHNVRRVVWRGEKAGNDEWGREIGTRAWVDRPRDPNTVVKNRSYEAATKFTNTLPTHTQLTHLHAIQPTMSLLSSFLIHVLIILRGVEHKIRSVFRRNRKDNDDRCKRFDKFDDVKEAQSRTSSEFAREDIARGDFVC